MVHCVSASNLFVHTPEEENGLICRPPANFAKIGHSWNVLASCNAVVDLVIAFGKCPNVAICFLRAALLEILCLQPSEGPLVPRRHLGLSLVFFFGGFGFGFWKVEVGFGGHLLGPARAMHSRLFIALVVEEEDSRKWSLVKSVGMRISKRIFHRTVQTSQYLAKAKGGGVKDLFGDETVPQGT